MKTILVPVDFSDNSKNALNYAVQLASKLNMKIVLVHAFHPSMAEAINDLYTTVISKNIIGNTQAIKENLKNWQKAIVAEKVMGGDPILLEGDLADSLNEIVEENEIDFIVMGTKGATGLKSTFIGSNTAKVIETVVCPVLAIPGNYTYKDFQNIAFATDYHDSDINSINFLLDLSKSFHPKLEIVHIANDDIKPRFEEDLLNHFMSEIKKTISYKNIDFHLIEGEDDIPKALNQFITKNKIDLIAISTVDRILRGPIFNRGVAKKLTHQIQVPLFAFHAFDEGDFDLF